MTPQTPFIARVLEEPLLVDPTRVESFEACLHHLANHEDAPKLLARAGDGSDDEFWPASDDYMSRYRPYQVQNGVLQIPVQGVLLNRFSYQFGSFATGYQYIERAMKRGLADPDVRGIAFLHDTPGGEVAGNFELAAKIFNARDAKPLRAFAADRSLSAGYSLASAASQVVVTASGRTGSIGVVTMHIDQSERLAKAGIKVTYIFAGKHKVDGNSEQPLPDDVKERIQGQIDKIYGVFTGLVATNRGLEEKDVRKTEALVYDADASVEHGLADRIGSFEDEIAGFAEEVDGTGEFQMSKTNDGPTMISPEDHEAALAAAREEASVEATAAATTEAVAAERARFSAVTENEAYVGREGQAHRMLAKTDLSAEQIVELLEAAPKAAPKAAGKGSESHFTEHMDSDEHPNVGPDGDEGGGDEKGPAANSKRLLGALAAATGYGPRKSNTQH